MWLGLYLLLCIAQIKQSVSFHKSHNEQYIVSELPKAGLSTPEECLRVCKENERPKTCYWKFIMENYNALGGGCTLYFNNATADQTPSDFQCVLVDGVERGILSVNRMVPGPSIEVCEGDKVVIDVDNRMSGLETSIHWHGVFQQGSQYYDGVPRITQCPILESTTFRYQWQANNAGTHFWHSHDGVQELDGIFGKLVVRQPQSKDPNGNMYDDDLSDHVIIINDWMHLDAAAKFPGLLKHDTAQKPNSVLINGKGQFEDPNTGVRTNIPFEVFTVKPGRRYRFRLINSFATYCPADISFEGHNLTIIAADGVPVKPVVVDSIVTFSGERYDFIINADQPDDAYWIRLRGLGDCGPARMYSLGVLRYESGPKKPSSSELTYDKGNPVGVVLNPLDGICNKLRDNATCVNQLKNAETVDKRIFQKNADIQVMLPFKFLFYSPEELFLTKTFKNFLVHAPIYATSLVGELSFEFPPTPPLSQIEDIDPQKFCNSDNRPADCGDDCKCIYTIEVPLHSVVEVVLIDQAPQENLSHPFHLHGYTFNVIGMGVFSSDNLSLEQMQEEVENDKREFLGGKLDMPPSKDTISVPQNGYVIFRFVASNPGWWLFHCHFLYHMLIGMVAVFHVGTAADVPPIPPKFPTCGNYLPPIH